MFNLLKQSLSSFQGISLSDLSITSEKQNESDDELCQGELFTYKFEDFDWQEKIYPDVFPLYPNNLIVRLSNFIKPFRRHSVAKLLHYELNCALLIHQMGYRLGKIKRYYQKDERLNGSVQVMEYYLRLHSISYLCRLLDMVKWLINKKEVSYKWQQNYKAHFNDLKTNSKIAISQYHGINLLLAIDNFTYSIIKYCSQLKYQQNKKSFVLSNIDMSLFDNLSVPLDVRIKLIPKVQDIILPKIQAHFQDQEIIKEFHICTKTYFNKLYNLIHQFYLKNSKDRQLNELLYFLIIAKLAGDNLPLRLMAFIKTQKQKIKTTSKIIKAQNFQEFIIQSNIYFRAELSKIHYLLKNRGFMKLLSFIHQSQISDIQKQINWCYDAKVNLINNI